MKWSGTLINGGAEVPIMVRTSGEHASTIFLGKSDGQPKPGLGHSRGLLLLSLTDLAILTQEAMTLGEFLNRDGHAIIGEPPLDHNMPLFVSDPVHALARVLALHPEILFEI